MHVVLLNTTKDVFQVIMVTFFSGSFHDPVVYVNIKLLPYFV